MENISYKYLNEDNKRNNLFPRCVLCGEVPKEGIMGGFTILKQFICYNCEEKILTLSYCDPAYEKLIKDLKHIFYKN